MKNTDYIKKREMTKIIFKVGDKIIIKFFDGVNYFPTDKNITDIVIKNYFENL